MKLPFEHRFAAQFHKRQKGRPSAAPFLLPSTNVLPSQRGCPRKGRLALPRGSGVCFTHD
jgi:hypothetical protein